MDKRSCSIVIFFLFVTINQSDCFVLQLPDCGRYHGNFSERHNNKYFTTTIGETIRNVTRRECSLHCTLHRGCLFFNHKMDNSECELLTSYKGNLTEKPGWQFVSTSHTDVHLRGPLCRYIGPSVCAGAGDRGKHCADSCTAPGFECKADVDIAAGKNMKASSEDKVGSDPLRKASNAVEGDPNTFWAPEDTPGQWLLFDLGERRYVAYFWWQHLPGSAKVKHYGKMTHLRIRVGDKDQNDLDGNELCAENLDHSALRNNLVYCTKGPMRGRYVVLQKASGGTTNRFYVNEMKIFALD